mgnify:FL=1
MRQHVTLSHALQQRPANSHRAMLCYVSLIGLTGLFIMKQTSLLLLLLLFPEIPIAWDKEK